MRVLSLAAAIICIGGCDAPPAQNGAAEGKAETFNERMARQRREIPGTSKATLPAPEGEPIEVAQAAVTKAGSKCTKVTGAKRFDSDGTIIAECGESEFRIFKIEGSAEAMPLDCRAARDTFGVDPCDEAAVASGKDDSIGKVLTRLAG